MFEGQASLSEAILEEALAAPGRWGVSSETGRLTDVLLSAPPHLQMIPCNDITRQKLAEGHCTSLVEAAEQHHGFADALRRAGVRCHFVTPCPTMPDLCFTRDAVMMSPWGLIGLRPSAAHRRGETAHVLSLARQLGIPIVEQIGRGSVEGGDVCLARDGLALIGVSGDRTNLEGATALASIFERRGWNVVRTPLNPKYLHLDTVLTMVDRNQAVICLDAIDPALPEVLRSSGIQLIPATLDEVFHLNANILGLGNGRVISTRGGNRLNAVLSGLGLEVIDVQIAEFTRCGGGPHCLTMPLARCSN